MSTTLPAPSNDGDRRGAPPGRFGNVPFVKTEEMSQKVRTLAKTMKGETQAGQEWIASLCGFSPSTLTRHFKEELTGGRAEIVSSLGAKMVGVAMGTVKDVTKEQLDAIKFTLARLGGWSTKVEMTGHDGRPMEVVDLSNMTAGALREYGRQAAIQQGLDPDEAVGPPLDD